MPDRRFGLEPEALGIVTLEASATGKPVIIGVPGGAPDTVRHGETGYLVDPYNPAPVGVRIAALLTDPARATQWAKPAKPGSATMDLAPHRPTQRELLDI